MADGKGKEMKPHKQADLIHKWADGAKIQSRRNDTVLTVLPPKKPDFTDDPYPTWSENMEYRIKPEPPKYPQTKMTGDDIAIVFQQAKGGYAESFVAVANAAIARAIEDKQVFMAESVKKAIDAANTDMVPEAMLEQVAKAVHDELVALVARYSTGCSTYIKGEIDLAAIIAAVKEQG
jgi:hypothetical protein